MANPYADIKIEENDRSARKTDRSKSLEAKTIEEEAMKPINEFLHNPSMTLNQEKNWLKNLNSCLGLAKTNRIV